MRSLHPFAVVACLAITQSHAQQQPALLGDPPDGSEQPGLIIRAAFKPAQVLETTVHRQGGRKIIVQHLALDPKDPVIPVRSRDIPVPAATASPENFEPALPFHLLLLSATVYPGPATYLRWTHQFNNGDSKEYSGWSNIDFNHISGISTFLATDGEQHSFVMGIGTQQEVSPDAPKFKTTAPTFLPDQKEIPAEALITVDSLHKLYAIEKEKLAAAHAGRQRAAAAKEAELLANPPQPKDLIIRYRIAETPSAQDTRSQDTRSQDTGR